MDVPQVQCYTCGKFLTEDQLVRRDVDTGHMGGLSPGTTWTRVNMCLGCAKRQARMSTASHIGMAASFITLLGMMLIIGRTGLLEVGSGPVLILIAAVAAGAMYYVAGMIYLRLLR